MLKFHTGEIMNINIYMLNNTATTFKTKTYRRYKKTYRNTEKTLPLHSQYKPDQMRLWLYIELYTLFIENAPLLKCA